MQFGTDYENKLSSELFRKERVKLLECLNCSAEKKLIPHKIERTFVTKGRGVPVRTDTYTTFFEYVPLCHECSQDSRVKLHKLAKINEKGDSLVKPQELNEWYLFTEWMDFILQKDEFKQCLHNGLILKTNGNQEEANIYFDKALEINSESELSLYFKAEISIAMGNYEEGLKYYDEAVKKDPTFEDALKKKTIISKKFKKQVSVIDEKIESIVEFPFKPPKFQYKLNFSEAHSVCIVNPNGEQLIILLKERQQIQLIDIKTGTVIKSMNIGRKPYVNLFPDGEKIILHYEKKTILHIIDINSLEVIDTIDTKRNVIGIHISSDKNFIVIGPTIYDLSDFSIIGKIKGIKYFNMFTPDNKTLIIFNSKNQVELWDVQSKSKVKTLREPNKEQKISFFKKISPDSKYLIIVIQDKLFEVWDLTSGSLVSSIKEEEVTEETVTPLRFGILGIQHSFELTPNGKSILISSLYHNLLYEYDLDTGSLIRSIPYPSDIKNTYMYEAFSITPNGQYIYLKGKSRIYILDYKKGQLVSKIEPGLPLHFLKFTSDNKYLITTHPYGVIMTWELEY